LLVLFSFAVAFGLEEMTDHGCFVDVQGFVYNLTQLAQGFGEHDASCLDIDGNEYFYRPCQPVSRPECWAGTWEYTPSEPPAVCQRDTRRVPQYHSCGSLDRMTVHERKEGPGTGFVILFKGGETNRQTTLEFVCDNEKKGPDGGGGGNVGTFEAPAPTERPTHHYHLRWTTTYACPALIPLPGALPLDGGSFSYTLLPWGGAAQGNSKTGPLLVVEGGTGENEKEEEEEEEKAGIEANPYPSREALIKAAALKGPVPPPPDDFIVLLNSFSVTLKEGAEPHAVAHDIGCLNLAKVMEYYYFRCGPDLARQSISPAITLPDHEAVLEYRQLSTENPKYISGRYY